jgi:hypothetical protein
MKGYQVGVVTADGLQEETSLAGHFEELAMYLGEAGARLAGPVQATIPKPQATRNELDVPDSLAATPTPTGPTRTRRCRRSSTGSRAPTWLESPIDARPGCQAHPNDQDFPMGYIIGVAIGALFAYLTSAAAKKRGRDPALWAVLGFLFGFIPLIILVAMARPALTMEESGGAQCPKCASVLVTCVGDQCRCNACGHDWTEVAIARM